MIEKPLSGFRPQEGGAKCEPISLHSVTVSMRGGPWITLAHYVPREFFYLLQNV